MTPLGAGGTRRETQTGRGGFRKLPPDDVAGSGGEQRLQRLNDRLAARDLRRRLRLIDKQYSTDGRHTGRDATGQEGQIGTGDQDPGPRLNHHGRQLGFGQTGIKREAHRPQPHDSVPDLNVRLTVPRQRAHPVTDPHT